MARKSSYGSSIEHRLVLENIVEEGSQRFINAGPEGIDKEIDIILRKMGEFADVDRSYVFLFSEDKKSMSNTNEWCAEGVEPQIENLQNLRVDHFNWIVQELEEGRNINISHLEELPAEAINEKEILKMQHIESLAIVSMIYGGELRGYLGFDSTNERIHWKEEDFSLLQTMSNIIISAIEHRRMEKRMRRFYKMEALERFAGEIAHDFNNILTAIKGNVQLLQLAPVLRDEDRGIIEAVIQGAESASDLNDQLLDFSLRRPHSFEKVAFHELVFSSIRMLERLLPENVEVETQLEAREDTLDSDRSQLERLILNLVKNSAEAMPEGGKILLRTRNLTFQKKEHVHAQQILPGDYLLFQVSDTGYGMNPATAEKALEPFFSTKDKEKGVGLGLSTVYTVVQQHNGLVEIHSKEGKGTTIEVYLPLGHPQ